MITKMLDQAFMAMERKIAKLEAENARLRRREAELLGQLVSSQDLAYNRMVLALAGLPVTKDAPAPRKTE